MIEFKPRFKSASLHKVSDEGSSALSTTPPSSTIFASHKGCCFGSVALHSRAGTNLSSQPGLTAVGTVRGRPTRTMTYGGNMSPTTIVAAIGFSCGLTAAHPPSRENGLAPQYLSLPLGFAHHGTLLPFHYICISSLCIRSLQAVPRDAPLPLRSRMPSYVACQLPDD
ncbi:unnamed protein product [Cyclocybe aegerita]|uniref:Uncharacterized protein n=1 Tax=Cyclocybe aegerita TaxID=1973307 RepID=A0A8S0X5C4_CYCAE|nr:unnamed protein product [Cyclocybe aegerita]